MSNTPNITPINLEYIADHRVFYKQKNLLALISKRKERASRSQQFPDVGHLYFVLYHLEEK